MKKAISFILSLLLILSNMTGCSHTPSSTLSAQELNLEEMQVYQVLAAGIHDDSTLEEMMDAFSAMCQVPMETTCDVYYYDVQVYEYEGQQYLHFLVTRQFEIPTYHEFLDCGFSVTYLVNEDIAELQEFIHREMPWEDFVSAVKSSEAYQALIDEPIHEYAIGIDGW